jgi:uracil-DNA glycosylase family 4
MEFSSLEEARREASRCALCTSTSNVALIPLVTGRSQVVFGVGASNADLMLIGEAPGKDEDKRGEPFVGKNAGQAGRILDERLAEISVLRSEVYITNVVMCRPTKVIVGRPPSNRAPEKTEVEACAPWLDMQVKLVPRLIVTLGVPATSRVLGRKVSMAEVHGEVIHGDVSAWKGRVIVPTYHPTGIRGNAHRLRAFRKDFEVVGDVYWSLMA